MNGGRWRGWGWWLAWLTCVLPQRAQADDAVYVQVASDGCPDLALLEAALRPLLGEQSPLRLGSEPATEGARPIVVRDQGASYVVEVADKRREVEDPARDCAERARVAAVFIALNVHADAKTPPAPTPPPPPPITPQPPALGFALRIYGGLALAPGFDVAPAIGLGAALEADAWRVALDAMLLGTITRDLPRADGVTSRMELTRVPWTISVGHPLVRGALSIGPALGMAIDVLQLRGQQVTRPQRETRVNFGALAALEARVALGAGLRLLAQGSLAAFPRAYRVSIDPLGSLEHTPRLWIGAHLGLEGAL